MARLTLGRSPSSAKSAPTLKPSRQLTPELAARSADGRRNGDRIIFFPGPFPPHLFGEWWGGGAPFASNLHAAG